MAIASGVRLGTYQVLAPLGAGGMGEVYRALDTKLKREVAIKILPDEFAGDPERVSRFQREAEALAALNHTNIASIYDFQEASGHRFLVLELVAGETLADRIGRGPLALDEALRIAKQIAEALEAAHAKSIVHRDLKPANIKLTPDGKVKVLDFGLAKVFQPESADADFSKSPTLMSGTLAGVILGTAAYMSPEQARGQATDHRTDIWAFGCVLYEMLTGKQAFDGQTLTDVLGGIVRVDPDWQLLPDAIPPMVRYLLRRCFDKNRARRLQSITEARVAIEDVSSDPALTSIVAAPPQKPGASRIERLAWAAAVLALAIAAGLFYARTLIEQPETRLQIVTPPTTDPLILAVSPDGRRLVFSGAVEGRNQLLLRSLDSVTAQPLSGTEGGLYPFWSPDSRWIGFFADGKLKRIDIAGGTAQTIADAATGRGGSWNREDIILFAPTNVGGLYRVSASGGQVTEVTKAGPPRQATNNSAAHI
jgi:serine/threonine protein kinase